MITDQSGAVGPYTGDAFGEPKCYNETREERRAKVRALQGGGKPRQRLVSMGWTKVPLDVPGRGNEGKVRLVDVETLFDANDAQKMYRRYSPGGPLVPIFDESPALFEPEPLGVVDINNPGPHAYSAYPAALPDRSEPI
jgi:hypothetical protein